MSAAPRLKRYGPVLLWTVLLCACTAAPTVPDWKLNTVGATERAISAYLSGRTRIEALEFAKARAEVARTGKADLIARVELARCATRVASLVIEDCTAFDALAPDVGPTERAYANYLAGKLKDQDIALLPPQHRAVPKGGASAVRAIQDPLARLVAAGALFKAGQADPALMALATNTASDQGWSRPLLAWLQVQAKRAELAGEMEEQARLQRRIDLILQVPAAMPTK